MSFLNIIAIAIALAMDAFAVAIATGVFLKNVNFRHVFRLSWHFGFFQAMMPVIGWAAGVTVRPVIEGYDHWIAFGLLCFVSGSMLKEAFDKKDENHVKNDPTKGTRLVVLSVATSIDALAVGLTLSVLNISVWMPAGIIGVTAIIFTAAGLYIGSRAAHTSVLSRFAELSGSIVLFAIGVKILYEHNAIPFLSG